MNLTTKGRYAVMAMADLATQTGTSRLADIAARQHIPHNYLEQLFCQLKKHDLVNATRGVGGGYQITDSNITVLQVIQAVEESTKMTKCGANSTGCVAGEKCLTHDIWDGLEQRIEHYFAAITLDDISKKQLATI